MRGAPSPPVIFERLKLPQQIIYRQKENLSESPNHQKYWENVFFSRNRRNLGHFRRFEKTSNSVTLASVVLYIILKHVIWRFQIFNLFANYLNLAKIKTIKYFAKFVNAFVKPRNLNFSLNKLYIWNLQITRFKMIYNMFEF